MAGDEFFEAADDQNLVKTQIVTKYFDAWSTIMLHQGRDPSRRIAYIDLFSGPGRFDDGSRSTPLWVLERAIAKPALCQRLVTMFNDRNPDYVSRLKQEISALPGIENLAHQPQISNIEVGQDLVNLLRGLHLVPTLFFIDPWGYKGLSLDLIGTAVRNWGCDCIFFFNYNRINPGINNPYVAGPMADLFGDERVDALRAKVSGLEPDERQATIISELSEALKQIGGRHVLPFEFQSPHGERPSHYIIFVSKAFRGYDIMRDVMLDFSSDAGEVKDFRYIPVRSSQMALFPEFGKSHSIPLLKQVMVSALAGQRLTVEQVHEAVTVDTPYTLKNTQAALMALEAEGAVYIDPPADKRRKIKGVLTLARDKTVTFPT